MFQQFVNWIKSLFGKATCERTQAELYESERYKRRYEDTEKINFDAIFAGTLANKAVTDCELIVTDKKDKESRRSEFISRALRPVWDSFKGTLSQALGKGGKFLIPYVIGKKIYVAAVDQNRCVVNRMVGRDIVSLSVIAESREVNRQAFRRVIDYTLENGGILIKTKIIDENGKEVTQDVIPEWAGITPEISIGNVDRVLVGYLKCPKDSRREGEFYGVPVTYGAEDTIRQLHECMEQIENEYRLKRAFVGADEALFGKDGKLPDNGLFKKFRAGGALDGGKNFWEVFDPSIRDSSYYTRYSTLCAQLEKEVGTSRGILTEPATIGATATEIKSANHSTFCMVSDIRKNIQACFEDLAYAIDVYAEFFNLTPAGAAGDYKINFDWDMSLVESSSETFDQLSELESRGLISGARLNSWVIGQSMEDAQAEIDAVREQEPKGTAMILKPEDFEPETR